MIGYFGDQVRFLPLGASSLSSGPALALQARFAPLRFGNERATVTLLGLDVGGGFDTDEFAPALAATFLEIALPL
ncbi:hypothetical protein D3C87_2013190 [compost metagenome]